MLTLFLAFANHELLDAAKAAARRAGHLIKTSEARSVETKANAKDLLTQTDKLCQSTIREVLDERCPGLGFLGEEDVGAGALAATRAAQALSGLSWVVDPLDGTANFVSGLPLSTVSIACVEGDRTLVGCVYDPFRDELFTASRGQGAFVNGVRMSVDDASLSESIVYAGAPPTLAALRPSLRGIHEVAPRVRTLRMLGSAALMLAYVAAGRGAAYFECDLSAWDTSAGCLLITEAGGKCTDAKGVVYTPTTRQIVATNGRIHDELLTILDSVDGAVRDDD